MNTVRSGWGHPSVIRRMLLIASVMLIPATAFAGYKVFDKDDQTLELGMRLQGRMEYSRVGATGGGTEWMRDFMIRRARLKANGKMQGVSFGFEWKIDGTDQSTTAATSSSIPPFAQVENAWMQYPLRGAAIQARAGLFDAPFSRDLLTSDSKQLAVDRGAVSAVPSALGLVDNVVGFDFRGGLKEGHYQYTVGLYDNRNIPTRRQDVPMLAGRLDLNFGSTKDIYQDAHFGHDKWYCLGVNGSVQSSIDGVVFTPDSLTSEAVGADGMLDIPAGRGRLMLRGEINAIRLVAIGPTTDRNSTVRMVGAGYLMMKEHLQPFVRFDQIRGDLPQGVRLPGVNPAAVVPRDITYVGANFYQKGHSLKVQGDLLFLSGSGESLDGGRLQAQIDF